MRSSGISRGRRMGALWWKMLRIPMEGRRRRMALVAQRDTMASGRAIPDRLLRRISDGVFIGGCIYSCCEHSIFLAFTRFHNGIHGIFERGAPCSALDTQYKSSKRDDTEKYFNDQAIYRVSLHPRGSCLDESLQQRNLRIDIS